MLRRQYTPFAQGVPFRYAFGTRTGITTSFNSTESSFGSFNMLWAHTDCMHKAKIADAKSLI